MNATCRPALSRHRSLVAQGHGTGRLQLYMP